MESIRNGQSAEVSTNVIPMPSDFTSMHLTPAGGAANAAKGSVDDIGEDLEDNEDDREADSAEEILSTDDEDTGITDVMRCKEDVSRAEKRLEEQLEAARALVMEAQSKLIRLSNS